MPDIRTIGILTGGGDCPGLNAVIRVVTKAAILKGIKVIGFLDGFEGLIQEDYQVLDMMQVGGILSLGGTILGTSNKANPFAYPNADGDKEDMSDKVMEIYARLKIDFLVAIGGDGTMSIVQRLIDKGLKAVGVPKTIDNDIYGTDRSFGFDTAVATASDAMDKLHTTAQAHHRIMLIEVMGRNAGWISFYIQEWQLEQT